MRLLEEFHTSLVVICSGMCRVGFTGCDAPRVIFPCGVAKPNMLCILAGMDQKDCFDMVQGWFCWYFTPRAVFLPCLQARDARHHGLYGPEGQFYARLSVAIPQVQLLDEVVVPVVCSRTVEVPQLQFLDNVVDFPVVAQRLLPWFDSSADH